MDMTGDRFSTLESMFADCSLCVNAGTLPEQDETPAPRSCPPLLDTDLQTLVIQNELLQDWETGGLQGWIF